MVIVKIQIIPIPTYLSGQSEFNLDELHQFSC